MHHVATPAVRATTQSDLYTKETKRYNTQNSKCRNILKTLTKGQWNLKNKTTSEDFMNYQQRDLQMRLRKGWPANLYHGDLRCGKNYPLPRLIKINKSEGSYLDIASQCDPLSEAPCCRDDIGWCGKGDMFCNCNSCTDFRSYIPAEIADWEPFRTCQTKMFTQRSACQLINKSFTSITFVGDSLVRHLFTALVILLTNDGQYGGLRTKLPKTDQDYCKGENQFTDSACHTKLAMNWTNIKENKKYCKTLTNQNKPIISFVEAFSSRYANLALNTVRSRMVEVRPLILLGIGVHDNYDHKKVIRTFLDPIIYARNSATNSNPLIIWLNSHSSGPLKPIEFQILQGNRKIEEYNSVLDSHCEQNDIAVLDTYQFTKGIHSFDGTHYGYEVNRLKAQILLHGLKEIANLEN